MRGLGLGFTNPVGTGECCTCVCFLGCRGVCGEWIWGLDQGLEGWCYVSVSPNSLCRWQVQVSVFVLGGYLRILGAPSIQSCCTLSPAMQQVRMPQNR